MSCAGNCSGGLLSAKQLAAMLGLSVNHLARLRMEGGGPPFFKLGQGARAAVRYRREDVDAWLGERLRHSTCDPGPQEHQ